MPETVVEVEVFPVRVPVRTGFHFGDTSAGKAGEEAILVLVRLRSDQGNHGWGMCRNFPQWNYDTAETTVLILRKFLGPLLMGHPLWNWRGLHEKMLRCIGRGPSDGFPAAKAAIDIAYFDLCARSANLPLKAILGGAAGRTSLPLSWTCCSRDTDQLKDEVEMAAANGFSHYNFKAGLNPAGDLAIAESLRALMPSTGFLWVDCNQCLEMPGAGKFCRALEEIGVDLLEQPFKADQYWPMKRLREMTSLPLALDESTVSASDFARVAAEGMVDFLVIKITRTPGILPSLDQVSVARALGISLITSGLCDGLITKLAAAHLATAVGVRHPMALNGSQFIDEDHLFPQKPSIESEGSVHLSDRPGLGVDPNQDAILAFSADL